LAGTFIDHRPFSPDLVAKRRDPNLASDKKLKDAMDKHQTWRQELADITTKQGWNNQDYHNFFILLPTQRLAAQTDTIYTTFGRLP
jgi:hypothetical protein